MSYLSRTLVPLMKKRGWSQADVEDKTGIAQSQISRYANGVIPDQENAERLFMPFGEDGGPELLAAYLKDCAPKSMVKWVSITPADADHIVADDAQLEIYQRLTPRASQVLTRLAVACEKNPDMISAAETILALAKA